MTLIKSISGIRGTIGGKINDNLTPIDTVKFAAAYGTWLKENYHGKINVIVGRDARISGEMISNLVTNSLIGLGIDVIDLGLSTTPTVEILVTELQAQGGIIITASHNPKHWNALKLLNNKGEFISATNGKKILDIATTDAYMFAEVDSLGTYTKKENAIDLHINKILELPLVQVDLIKSKKYKIVVDAVHSTGGISVPILLQKLGCEVIEMYCTPTGDFPHNPEPLAENLTEICQKVIQEKADLGIVVDPDVDRLALVCEDGTLFGEEYTLVAIAAYILKKLKGNTVSNLSSSRALADITKSKGGVYFTAAVGEVNVVEKMKEVKAVIGGEGNGGIIYPDLHYGRDALVGIGLFLSYMTENNKNVSTIKKALPNYFMSKNKIELTPDINVDEILQKLQYKYQNEKITTIDGVKIDFENQWIHFRKSNTEPIIRIYTEAKTQKEANDLALNFIKEIQALL